MNKKVLLTISVKLFKAHSHLSITQVEITIKMLQLIHQAAT